MKARVFYPSIYCDGTVSVFTVGTAEGRMLKKLHLDIRDDCVIVCMWGKSRLDRKCLRTKKNAWNKIAKGLVF